MVKRKNRYLKKDIRKIIKQLNSFNISLNSQVEENSFLLSHLNLNQKAPSLFKNISKEREEQLRKTDHIITYFQTLDIHEEK